MFQEDHAPVITFHGAVTSHSTLGTRR